ncbi:ABC transporter ATP-binding protein [Salipiger sp. P9]|uniref:ABC transporter ATP-binding protein n=1 Tax=Salipiger pentaromativorans TaxID=2943193 RepID=UPI0021587710|nr:ABC transporter ATP-binding protein [Salipiger pentaromativorans]MCR8548840.1 ABC transporter ATP-binding protein [Salipiger pentaromativorans]
MLEIRSLSLVQDGDTCLDDVSIRFEPGQLTTLLGRTLAGKTSLMRAIAGLVQPDAGSIALDGTDWLGLPPWRRPVAMVTQQFINYPHLSVLDNVAFPLLRRGVARDEARDRARDMLGRVGLADFTDRRPGRLSGGQQQRVAIARALVKKAPVLLLDEPFVNLDYKLREGLREELIDILTAETGTMVVYASTDPREALQMGDRVVLLSEGRVVQAGPPRTVYGAPVSVAAAQVVSDPPINLLELDVAEEGAEVTGLGAVTPADLGRALPPGRYTLGLRAHDLRLGGPHAAHVALTEVSGSETVTHLVLAGQNLVMLERTVTEHALGATIGIGLDLTRARVFDATGTLVPNGADHG